MEVRFYADPKSIFREIQNEGTIYFFNLYDPKFRVVTTDHCQKIITNIKLEYAPVSDSYILTIANKKFPDDVTEKIWELSGKYYIGMAGLDFLLICPLNPEDAKEKLAFLRKLIKRDKSKFEEVHQKFF